MSKEREACEIIKKLMSVLPDSYHDTEDWKWCWNELFVESQELVKQIRQEANLFIELNKGN